MIVVAVSAVNGPPSLIYSCVRRGVNAIIKGENVDMKKGKGKKPSTVTWWYSHPQVLVAAVSAPFFCDIKPTPPPEPIVPQL